MLVLSRKIGQRFQIGDEIRLTIVRIDRNSVRIGVEAPDGQAIYREELLPLDEDESGHRPRAARCA
jgi:carbon storage regulator